MKRRLNIASFVACSTVACLVLSGTTNANDALFSEIAMESVFAKSTQDLAAKTSSTKTTSTKAPNAATNDGSTDFDRITGPNSLTVALRSAGFEPRRNREAVLIRVERAGWKLTTEMTVEVEKDRILCRMSLIKIDSATTNLGETLRALMTINHRLAEASFVVDGDANMVQLQAMIANRNLTSDRLTGELMRLADTAIENADAWRTLKAKSSVAADAVVTVSPPASAPMATQQIAGQQMFGQPIFGQWLAGLPSNTSIAIELKEDDTFKMAHVAANRVAVSSGTVRRRSNRLTLSEQGKDDVNFQIESVTTSVMELRIVDSSDKSGRLIKFSKAGL